LVPKSDALCSPLRSQLLVDLQLLKTFDCTYMYTAAWSCDTDRSPAHSTAGIRLGGSGFQEGKDKLEWCGEEGSTKNETH